MAARLPRLLLLAGSLAAAGCSARHTTPSVKPPACGHGRPMTRTYLFFGQKTARFRRTEIARAFSESFTVIDARGFRRARQGHTLWEDAKVVIRLHRGRAADHAAIETLRRRYKAQFRQQSVLRIDENVCASF